jgi:DNA topoisomerase VI subunit B
MILSRRMKKLAAEVRKLNINAPVEWIRRIDTWRGQQPDVPSLSESIRRLVSQSLDAAERKGGKPTKPHKKTP